jgi:hypothetical protein
MAARMNAIAQVLRLGFVHRVVTKPFFLAISETGLA